ncbi:MAG TPA: hypothetical protein VK144_02625, partial [Bacillota bacterium]|nr:hypothetical protein [Bacillota bacterium]
GDILNRESNFEMFRYFLESYFNVSANYDELEEVINEFNLENIKYRKRLLTELQTILQLQDWEFVHEFVRVNGMRKMDKDKLEWFIRFIQEHIKAK